MFFLISQYYIYLPLLSRNCNVESSLVNGNFPLSQVTFGFGCPSYKQSNSTFVPAFRSNLVMVGTFVLNLSGTGSITQQDLYRNSEIYYLCRIYFKRTIYLDYICIIRITNNIEAFRYSYTL